nr:MAG TPA: hypothetical protein [Crassvirales sp.]
MKRFRTIFESAGTPPSENDLWLKKGELLYYSNEGWKNILGTADTNLSDYYTSKEVDNLLVLTKEEINNSIEQDLNLVYKKINTKQDQLNGVGYVKANGTSISYDNRTFVTGDSSGTADKAKTLSVTAISNFKTFNPATLNMRVGEIRMFKAASAANSPWGSVSSWAGFIILIQSGYWKYEALSSSSGDGIAIGYYRSDNGFEGWRYSPSLSSSAVSWNGGSPFELTIKNFNVNGVRGGLIAPSSWNGSYPLNIWAPTNAGAEGQVLTSSGAGSTPVWKDLVDIPAAESAKKLSNPRLIWGQSFDGTKDVDGAFTMNMNTGSHALTLNIPAGANVINVNNGSYTISANSIHTVDVREISSTFSKGWRYLDTKSSSTGLYVFGVYGNAGTVDYYFYGGNYSSPLLKINRNTSSPRAELSGIMQASGFKTPSGDSSQFLKADGSVDSNTYVTDINLTSRLDGYVTTETTINGKKIGNGVNLVPSDLKIQQKNININGSSKTVYAPNTEAMGTIYAPTSAGNAGQVLKSNGSGSPVWANFSEAEYGKESTFYFMTNNGGTIYVPGHETVQLPSQGSSGVSFYDRTPVFVSFNSRSQCRNLKLSLLLGPNNTFVLYQMSHKNVSGLNNGVMVQYDYTASVGSTYPTLAGIIFYPRDECTYSLEYNPT